MAEIVKDEQVSVRLPSALKDKLETYAQLTGRTKSYVAMDALGEYLAWRTPQVEDLKAAVAAADSGEFATDDEARAVFSKYRLATAPQTKAPAKTRRR